MRLTYLRLHNFMPYRGEQEVRFPTRAGQNVAVIYGDNMRGKTSILSAIRWALYGEVRGRHSKPIPVMHLINRDASQIGDFEMSVTVGFHHDGIDYEVVRACKPKHLVSTPREDAHLDVQQSLKKAGEPVSGYLIEHEINQILPEEISRFSLFDGELLQEYEQLVAEATEESDRIKRAIEQVLGVPTLTNARDHLAELLLRAQRQFNKEVNRGTQQGRQIDDLSSQLEDSRREEQKLDALQGDLQGRCDDLDERLKTFERAESVKAQVEEVYRQQAANMAARDRATQTRLALAPRAWMAIVEKTISVRKDALQESLLAVRDDYKSAVRSEVLRHLQAQCVTSGSCPICEQTLGQDLQGRLRALMGSQQSASESALGDKLTDSLVSLSKQFEKLKALGAPGVAEGLIRSEAEIDRATIEMQKLDRRVRDLLADIPGVDLEQISRWREQRDAFSKELGKIEGQSASQRAKTTDLKRKFDVAVKLAASGEQGSAQSIGKKVTLLSALSDVFEKSVDTLRHKLSETVEQAATATFKELTTEKKYAGLSINDRYGLEIRDHMERPVSVRSAGAEQIVALSLIDGLNKASGKRVPLVMDTPFGRLDPKHRANVLRYLPTMSEQVILLVHEGELNPDRDMANIAPQVAAKYEIERISPTQSRVVTR